MVYVPVMLVTIWYLTLSCTGTAIVKIGHSNLRSGSKELSNTNSFRSACSVEKQNGGGGKCDWRLHSLLSTDFSDEDSDHG